MNDLDANDDAENGDGATSGQQESGVGDANPLPARRRPYIGHRKRASLLRQFEGLDRRSLPYLETKRLIDAMQADLGGADQLSAAEKQMVQHAAILGAVIAKTEAHFLKHQRIDAAEYCLVVNAQRRLFETLGTRRRPRDVTPDLQTYLATKADRE
jgi:hypothetical protein